MKGSAAKIIEYLEGASKRYIIPVYQRKYEWKQNNCRQLYNDLKKIIHEKRQRYFLGSIVSSVIGNGNLVEYHIIDGQQRITTLTLLLLAIRNLINQGKLQDNAEQLGEQINQRFLISPWASEDDKIKLRPVKSDTEPLRKLFCASPEDYDNASKLTANYNFFCEQLLRQEVSPKEIYEAICKLEIISITLEKDDNPQLIFESLNSTGLALTEGDKIRNYVLMGQPPKKQKFLYETYWIAIEKCTGNELSNFIRDYLSVKQQAVPNLNSVYITFKVYSEKSGLEIEKLLEDLLRYARFYEKFLTCKSGINDLINNCLYRLIRLEIIVTRPFMLEVFRLNQENILSADDVLQIFVITENYLFRRNICDIPSNSLQKIFVGLNREILRFDGTTDNYVQKFIYVLLSKQETGRFPDDNEFSAALETKQIYSMRGQYKNYLFERFENFGTLETKAVYEHLDNNSYTIEHIMPQRLTRAWTTSLGENAEEIHRVWLHRLANLTLTAYNPNLSNKPFTEKRDAPDFGYKNSGIRMNQKIAQKNSWGLPELEERNSEMILAAKKIWELPKTSTRAVLLK